MGELDGMTAVVTGTAHGIGRAVADRLSGQTISIDGGHSLF
ncbi:MAG TPA: hypothetical protein VGD71_34710 [Kribbella sp.]|jgi:NAD(P)-dependent dehydrogenase (short-subunit alcohol dehydrogenase family)